MTPVMPRIATLFLLCLGVTTTIPPCHAQDRTASLSDEEEEEEEENLPIGSTGSSALGNVESVASLKSLMRDTLSYDSTGSSPRNPPGGDEEEEPSEPTSRGLTVQNIGARCSQPGSRECGNCDLYEPGCASSYDPLSNGQILTCPNVCGPGLDLYILCNMACHQVGAPHYCIALIYLKVGECVGTIPPNVVSPPDASWCVPAGCTAQQVGSPPGSNSGGSGSRGSGAAGGAVPGGNVPAPAPQASGANASPSAASPPPPSAGDDDEDLGAPGSTQGSGVSDSAPQTNQTIGALEENGNPMPTSQGSRKDVWPSVTILITSLVLFVQTYGT